MTEVVALLPAAGRARRLGLSEGSKEVLPLEESTTGSGTTLEWLLDALGAAGIGQALVVLRRGKWDVPARLSRRTADPQVSYRVLDHSDSVPQTLAHGLQALPGRTVLLAFPDILYESPDLFRRAVERAAGADLVLGLFECRRPDKSDMVELDDAGTPRRIVIKQPDRGLRWSWGFAVWGPRFSALVQAEAPQSQDAAGRERHIGHLVQQAIDQGYTVRAVTAPGAYFLDIGTPEDLARAREFLAKSTHRSDSHPAAGPRDQGLT